MGFGSLSYFIFINDGKCVKKKKYIMKNEQKIVFVNLF